MSDSHTTAVSHLLAAYPVLGAPDLPRTIAFFEALGFVVRFVDDPALPRYAAVRRDAVEVHLQWMAAVPVAPDGDRPVTRILVDDVDALCRERSAALTALGIVPSGPFGSPADSPWGTREWHLHDPAGNVLQWYQVVA